MRKCTLLILLSSLAAPLSANAAEIVVTMAGGEYKPDRIVAAVGDTIRFVNDSGMNHNVFIPTARFATDLGKQEPGSETVLDLARPGSFEVECTLHANMLTQVEVK